MFVVIPKMQRIAIAVLGMKWQVDPWVLKDTGFQLPEVTSMLLNFLEKG